MTQDLSEDSWSDLSVIDPHEQLRHDLDELVHLQEKLNNLEFWAAQDRHSSDEEYMKLLRMQIEVLEQKIRDTEPLTRHDLQFPDTIERIESDFNALYHSIFAEGVIQWSTRKYTADEVIERIKQLRASLKTRRVDQLDLIGITKTNGIRNRVKELLLREETTPLG